MYFEKHKIGVLGGGVSSERGISLISAKEVYMSLYKKDLDVVLIDVGTSDEAEVKKLILSYGINLAFIALHGEFGEDGKIQQILENLSIAYTGSDPKASLLAMDKTCSKAIFKKLGIATPDFVVVSGRGNISYDITYPVVVKPHACGSSLGLTIVDSHKQLRKAIGDALAYSEKVILENYIEGREVTVGILNTEPLAVVEIVSKSGHFDFRAKYSEEKARFIAPADLDKRVYNQVQDIALAAHKALGCRDFSRVDMRLDVNCTPYVLEVNSIPGFTPCSLLPFSAKACGIDFDELILKIVELALYDKEKKKIQKV